jgi:hypothetical protein
LTQLTGNHQISDIDIIIGKSERGILHHFSLKNFPLSY